VSIDRGFFAIGARPPARTASNVGYKRSFFDASVNPSFLERFERRYLGVGQARFSTALGKGPAAATACLYEQEFDFCTAHAVADCRDLLAFSQFAQLGQSKKRRRLRLLLGFRRDKHLSGIGLRYSHRERVNYRLHVRYSKDCSPKIDDSAGKLLWPGILTTYLRGAIPRNIHIRDNLRGREGQLENMHCLRCNRELEPGHRSVALYMFAQTVGVKPRQKSTAQRISFCPQCSVSLAMGPPPEGALNVAAWHMIRDLVSSDPALTEAAWQSLSDVLGLLPANGTDGTRRAAQAGGYFEF